MSSPRRSSPSEESSSEGVANYGCVSKSTAEVQQEICTSFNSSNLSLNLNNASLFLTRSVCTSIFLDCILIPSASLSSFRSSPFA